MGNEPIAYVVNCNKIIKVYDWFVLILFSLYASTSGHD